MFKRKQQLEELESERRELGLEKEDFDVSSSDSGSDASEVSENEVSGEEMSEEEESGSKSYSSKTKVMVLGSRGIQSRYLYNIIIFNIYF